MTLLQFIIIIASVVFFLFWIDLFKRKKATFLHLLVFIGWSLILILFAVNVEALNTFWSFFWIARGADLLVYVAIIVLAYFYITLFNKNIKDSQELTRLISALAIEKWYEQSKEQIKKFKNSDFKDEFIFNIRVYNEASMLWSVIDEIIKAWFKKLVFINDWSKDDSQEILEKKREENPNCIFVILTHKINRWWGAANQTWYKFIQKYAEQLNVSWFVWFDPDWQMDIKDMDTFISNIKKDNWKIDAYLWSRFIKWWSSENIPNSRKRILTISKIVTKWFYWIKVSDPHNWYRVINIEALKKIHLTADWMHYANELNEQLQKNHIKTKEVPVHIRYTDYSLWKGQKNSNSIKLWLQMIYQKIFFR